jgi:clan AA aspartic protease
MVHGTVRDNSALTTLQLYRGAKRFPAEVIIDTGFEGELALPANIVARLLPGQKMDYRTIMLADGRLRNVPFAYIDVIWHDEIVKVEALVTEGNPLLGMMMLPGSMLSLEVTDGGEVSIEPLD